MAFTQMGPSQVVDPIVAPEIPARGGLLLSVAVDEPTGAFNPPEMPGDDQNPPTEEQRLAFDEATRQFDQRVLESRRWENGYTWRPLGGCAEADTWAPCSGDEKVIDPTAPLVEVIPWTAYAGFTCSTWAIEEIERIAHAEIRLAARAGQAIELELWAGDIAQAMDYPNPYLASPAAVQLTHPGQVSALRHGLGNLQDAIRDCLGSEVPGVIHATPQTVALWASEHMVFDYPDGILRDIFGNIVIGGAGYATAEGEGPDGDVDPTGKTVWAYATGPVRAMLGPVYITPDDTGEALIRTTNDITWRAERTVSAAFDPCCLFANRISLCDINCNPAGAS